LFVINESCLGLIGLGNKITRQYFSEEELELLMTLVHHLMVFLDNTKSFETIQRLNIDLEKRNIELSKTIEHLSASKHKIEVLERAKARVKSAIQREMEKTARMSAKDFILILSVSLLLGLVFNLFNPIGVALIPQNWLRKTPSLIDLDWAKLKHANNAALFVDARPVEFFRQSHIQGAVNLPPALFDFVYMMNFGNLDTQKEIIVYGRNISSRYDEEVLFKLASRGHDNVKLFPDGLSAWKKNGFPLEP
ncbi:MAG: rhodanese-like domain-containing protein, partial [Proteobacteria bacterium]|nr:rhodanese-like domain-containing protein [Pseudomonadota bacterium]